VLDQVEKHVRAQLGDERGRASVSFVGVEPIEVLRFGPGGDALTRYVTLGMSRRPMANPAERAAHGGPRAELVLAIRAAGDAEPAGLARSLAVLAAMPVVEGVVVQPGSSYELGTPIWVGAAFSGVLVGDPVLPDLATLDEPVRFLGVEPIAAQEQAYKRVHGPHALRALWREQRIDPHDPARRQAVLA
jgi:hypothetical protein